MQYTNVKYTIEGFSQEALINLGCDPTDAVILRYIVDFYHSGSMKKHREGGKEYFWILYKAVIAAIPIIRISSPRVLQRRFERYVKSGLMDFTLVHGKETYFRFTPKYNTLIFPAHQTQRVEAQESPEDRQSQEAPVLKSTGIEKDDLYSKVHVLKSTPIDPSSINKEYNIILLDRNKKNSQSEDKPDTRRSFTEPLKNNKKIVVKSLSEEETKRKLYQQRKQLLGG